MDSRLQQAAESGSIDSLYALIDENPYILDHIDAVPFVNTPLHVAAAAGKKQFAMEMLNLKPSFARKLNTSGYSPLHLAVENDRRNFVQSMLWLDSSLASVKGRNGITPFLSLVLRGDVDLVVKCLETSPECIQDVSVNDQNALHLAVMNDRFEVLQVLIGWIERMTQRNARKIQVKVLNKRDFNSNTALHLAAYKSNHQAIRLLLKCRRVRPNKVNDEGSTFLDILRTQGQNASGENLEQLVLNTRCKEAALVRKPKRRSDYFKSPVTFLSYYSTFMSRRRSNISDESRGAFLIVCTLLLTATYQMTLQPPGGIHQSGDAHAGSVVMKHTFFIILWISNTLGFCCALFYTFCLIPLPVGRNRRVLVTWFFWIGASLCISYALAMAVIAPHRLVFLSATVAFFLLFVLYLWFELLQNYWRKAK